MEEIDGGAGYQGLQQRRKKQRQQRRGGTEKRRGRGRGSKEERKESKRLPLTKRLSGKEERGNGPLPSLWQRSSISRKERGGDWGRVQCTQLAWRSIVV